MLIILIALTTWAQPSFPPGAGPCAVEYLFPCSFETAIDVSTPLYNFAQTASNKGQIIQEYRTGKFDVEDFEPILFSDSKTLYGITQAQTHQGISDRVLEDVLNMLHDSSQDWIETAWGNGDGETTKFVHDVDLGSDFELNSAVFLRTTFADPWEGTCASSNYNELCAEWNLGISFAKTFYHLSKCRNEADWNAAVSEYMSGAFGVDGKNYATVYDSTSAPLANVDFSSNTGFPADLNEQRTWTNITTSWAYYLEFKRYDNQVYKVLGELTIPVEDDDSTTDVTDVDNGPSKDITDIINDSTKNETEKESGIQDILDKTGVDTVVVIKDGTETTITDTGVETTTPSEAPTLPPKETTPEPIWVRYGDSIGILTYSDDGSAIITVVYTGYSEVADSVCNSLYNMDCNDNAVPYYTSNVVLDLLNAGTNETKITAVLDMVKSGHYDRSNNYKPAIMNGAGHQIAQSEEDELYRALIVDSTDPNFSQKRLQLAWIAQAANGEPQWVEFTLNGNPWKIYVQAVGDHVVMLGYKNVDSPISTTESGAAGDNTGDSESDKTTMYIIIGVCGIPTLFA